MSLSKVGQIRAVVVAQRTLFREQKRQDPPERRQSVKPHQAVNASAKAKKSNQREEEEAVMEKLKAKQRTETLLE